MLSDHKGFINFYVEVYSQPPSAEYQQLPPVMQQAPPQQTHPDYPAVPQPVPAAAAPALMPQGKWYICGMYVALCDDTA